MVHQAVCLAKNVCIVTEKSNIFILPTDFTLGSHEKFQVHSWYCFVRWGKVVTATSLLMASLLCMYDTALHECLYFLCQVIQAVDRKTMILVLTSENCAEHRLLAQYLQCLGGSRSVASSGHKIY